MQPNTSLPLTSRPEVNRHLQAKGKLSEPFGESEQPFHEYLRETFKEDLPQVIADVLTYHYGMQSIFDYFRQDILANLDLFAFHPDPVIQLNLTERLFDRYPIRLIRRLISSENIEVAKFFLKYHKYQWLLPTDADRKLIDYTIECGGYHRFLNHPDPDIAAYAQEIRIDHMNELWIPPKHMDLMIQVRCQLDEVAPLMEMIENDAITEVDFHRFIERAHRLDKLMDKFHYQGMTRGMMDWMKDKYEYESKSDSEVFRNVVGDFLPSQAVKDFMDQHSDWF